MMRRAVPVLVLVLVWLTTSVAPAGAADDIGAKKDEAAQISRQLAEQGRKISVLAEQYNNARLEADQLAARLTAAKADMAETDATADALRARLKRQAVEHYVHGGAIPALAMLVESRIEDDVAIRQHYVRSVTTQVGDTLDQLRAVKLTLKEQTNELASAQRASREALAAVESAREQAVAAHDAQRRLLARVEGELAELIAAEERRKAEEEARRAQAELEARRAREEAAAREAAARETARRATTTTSTTARPAATVASPTTARPTTTTTAPKASGPTTSAPPPSSGAAAAVEEAKRQLGKPYEWGGSGPDTFDCSGLTSWAWRAGGKSLPHSSQSQYSATSRVALADIQPGDLLFYGNPIHHVAIYVGDGQMIEAPETGKNVRYASIYRRDYVGAGRVN